MLLAVAYVIRWRDPVLWPGMLRHVPQGFEAVTDPQDARGLIGPQIVAAGLPEIRAEHFQTLWMAWLDRGMQPSGLVLSRLGALTDAIGHESTGTIRRWMQFCQRRRLCVYVPGKLSPSRNAGSGERTRAFLVVKESEPAVRSGAVTFERITTNPDVMGGQPCLRGLRIPVATVVAMAADGMTAGDIIAELPDLTCEDVDEALRYGNAV